MQSRPQHPNRRNQPDQDDLRERKSNLRTMAVAGALATVGAFTALAASSDPRQDDPSSPDDGAQPSQQAPGSGAQPSLDDDDFVAPSDSRDGFQDPQGDFFDPGDDRSGVSPPSSGGMDGAPSQSGGS